MAESSETTFIQNQFKKGRAKNLAEIKSACENNMELQSLVLKYIRSDASRGESSVGQVLEKACPKKKTSEKGEEFGPLDMVKIFDKASDLQRGRFLYKNWEPAFLRELFYCVPGMRRSLLKEMRDDERLKECIEFAWDIRCTEHSSPLDRIPTTNKRQLFDALKNQYCEKGERLNALMEAMSEGWVAWKEHGHFSLSVVKSEDESVSSTIIVTYKAESKTGVVAAEIVECDDWSTVELKANHSLSSAHLQTASLETYTIKSLFPHFFKFRAVKRHNSDSGITAKVEGAPPKITKRGDGGTGDSPDYGLGMAMLVGVPPMELCMQAKSGEPKEE